MKILSIDWDYFFPDSAWYDWGHAETVMYLNMAWQWRVNNRHIKTGKSALTEYVPTIPKDFWNIVTNDPMLFVAESHAAIATLPMNNSIVTNLDAHHDCGYGANDDLECGNWAWWMKEHIKEYHLCYPAWRGDGEEAAYRRKPTTIIRELPAPADYDLVFVCRSGCWTPPWYDRQFRGWLKRSGMKPRYMDEHVTTVRQPATLKQAKLMKEQLDNRNKYLFQLQKEKVA